MRRSEHVFAFASAQVVAERGEEPVEFVGGRRGQLRAARRRQQPRGQFMERCGRQQEGRELVVGQRGFGERAHAVEPEVVFALQAGTARAALLQRGSVRKS